MHFLSPLLESYLADNSQEEPKLLKELTRETHLKVIQPRMLTGHFQGRVLSLLSKIIRPRTILEIGTYTGYSALCLAEGLPNDGILHTIDVNAELERIQRKYFDLSGYGTQIVQHIGNALDIIPQMDQTFDLVFIDAEKKQYDHYLEAVLPKTTSGSVILSDNVLWSGKVVEPLDPKDKATKVLLDYNKKLSEHPLLDTVLLPIRDGLTLSRVK
ncbi:Predicted O-methyltransferase YrrM [Maribacter sedimenticola]|uniref:Predicted O-methyltransferase YrrM n=1 Tax=Maribacter sedimenticola TaxID=228956 RepID=A0ABY1SN34_9FLAO|nr:O-methyltransferase [Maribacter sedimenticola]SNR81972.1 Predicted O-methyltransferase YrrM [Maribacter sedimenticola]